MPRIQTMLDPETKALRGFTREEKSGRVDCPCIDGGIACVLRHEDFVKCVMKMEGDDATYRFGIYGYNVYLDEPYPTIGERFRYDNVLTPIKYYLGSRGR